MKNKRILISILCVVLAAALMAGAYALFAPKGTAGAKEIQVTIVTAGGEKSLTLHTNEAYLRGALEEQKLVSGEEGPYGLYVKTVDGYTVNDANQEWWCFTKGGEAVMTGVDVTPVENGDHFEITLTVGY